MHEIEDTGLRPQAITYNDTNSKHTDDISTKTCRIRIHPLDIERSLILRPRNTLLNVKNSMTPFRERELTTVHIEDYCTPDVFESSMSRMGRYAI